MAASPRALRFSGREAVTGMTARSKLRSAVSGRPLQGQLCARKQELGEQRIGADHLAEPEADARVTLARGVNERGDVAGSVPSRYQKERLH